MKHAFKITVCAFVLSLGLLSCNKGGDPPGPDDAQGGKVTVSFGFAKDPAPESKADYTPSTTLPTTSWSRNIKDLLILFVDQTTSRVKDARNITPVPTSNDGAVQTVTFTNIVANTGGSKYDVYVIANSQQTASIKPAEGWNASNVKGRAISALLMDLVVNPAYATDKPTYDVAHPDPEANSTGYSEPAEIFLAKQPNIAVVADQNNTLPVFNLTRAVSLMRVRIDQHANGNDQVSFTAPEASFRIRRSGISLRPDGTVTYASPKRETAVLYTKGAFRTMEPTAADGYQVGAGKSILNAGEHVTLWKDILMLPGGGTVSAEKFDVVLIGKAPAGYVPLGKAPNQPLGSSGGRVAWSGAVNVGVTANNILEVTLPLESAGKWIDDPDEPGIPDVGFYAPVTIQVNLADWGNIISQTIPL